MAEICRVRDVELLDGRPPTVTVMVGGSKAGFERCRSTFEAIAAQVFHVGPSGAGATAKLVTQYLGHTNFIASIEAMLVAAKAGIDLEVMARIAPGRAGHSRISRVACFSGGSRPAGRRISPMTSSWPASCCAMWGQPASLGALASDFYKRAQAGWGQEGFPVVARVLEAMAGVELRPVRKGEP